MTLRCALKKISDWKMSILRIEKNPKQKKPCRKTVETDLFPKGTVTLSLLDFQNIFNWRIKKYYHQKLHISEDYSVNGIAFCNTSSQDFFCIDQPGPMWCPEENRILLLLKRFHSLSTERQLYVKLSFIHFELTNSLWQKWRKFGKTYTLN